MILRSLYLYPDFVDYEDRIVHPFRDQSRSICNYLERQLKPIRFATEGFKRVCFIGKNEPSSECFVNSSDVLAVEIPFDVDLYTSLKEDQLNTFFSEMLVTGIMKCRGQYEIPERELLDGLAKFREEGWVNRWTFKTRAFRDVGIKCALNCELTMEAFHLSLVITRKTQVVFEREILKTVPNEIVFVPMFKDVKLEGDSLAVVDGFGRATYRVMLDELHLGDK